MHSSTVSAESLTIVSDTTVTAYGPVSAYAAPGDAGWGMGASAVSAWVHSAWTTIPGATWISTSYYVEQPCGADSWRKFSTNVILPVNAQNIVATLTATSDNAEEVYMNGAFVGSDGEPQGAFVDDGECNTIVDYSVPNMNPGANDLEIIVRNYAGSSSQTGNPTGLIFKLDITYDLLLPIDIDIKPGSDPNSINLGAEGVVPVAILGSDCLDVTHIDQATLLMEGNAAREKGRSGRIGAFEDVNGDGFTDLVVQFPVEGLEITEEDTQAVVTGNLMSEFGGTPFEGSDAIQVVPPTEG